MKYLSVCSGIEAATSAWHPLGWQPVAFSEVEPFPSAVLSHHYPTIPNHGDMTRFDQWPDYAIDLFVGGTPCQSFSVAGLRKGLADPRGNLMLTYLAIAARYRPRWLVWENVPGVLSSNGGKDFGTLLGGLAELGYGFAYRILDAQYVRVESHTRAVPQRRRRVFVVGHLGDWRRAAAVLFERESLCGHPAPSRSAGKGTAPTLSARTKGGGGLDTDFDCDGGLIAAGVSPTLNAHFGDKQGLENQHINGGCGLFVAHALRGEGFDASEDGTGRGTPLVAQTVTADMYRSGGAVAGNNDQGVRNCIVASCFDERQVTSKANRGQCEGDVAGTQQSTPHAIAFSCKDHGADAGVVAPTLRSMGHDGSHANGGGQVAIAIRTAQTSANGHGISEEAAHTLDSANGQAVATKFAVRRLTPRECERLQGFPDDFTMIPWRGRKASDCPDGPRYKALGNSMATNCMRWIGDRIQTVEQIGAQQ